MSAAEAASTHTTDTHAIRENQMRAHLCTLAVAVTMAACGGGASSPSSPTPTPMATPAPSGASSWLVTQRFVSVTGPDNCWVSEQRARWAPAVFPDLPMTVTRTNAAIAIKGDFFAVNYAGTVSGMEFSATGVAPLEGGGGGCKDGSSFPQQPGVSSLSGRFPSDQLVTATEVNTYVLVSGGTVGWQGRPGG